MNDNQMEYIVKLRNEAETWEDIHESFNEHFGTNCSFSTVYKYGRMALRGDDFSSATLTKALRRDHNSKNSAKNLRAENKALLQELEVRDTVTETMTKLISKVKFKVHKKPKKVSRKKVNRSIVIHYSDTHIGALIDSKEMGGLNSFSPRIAARRTAEFLEQVVNYKPEHRDETDVVFVLNGDILQGTLHDLVLKGGAESETEQFVHTLEILVGAISYLSANFRNVYVKTTVGNHDRIESVHKGRATAQKWNSEIMKVYIALRDRFSATHNNVEFQIDKTPYCVFNVRGHKFLATHSDTFISVGNPGKNIATDKIQEKVSRINLSKIAEDSKVECLMLGHLHQSFRYTMNDGTEIIGNGCMSGLDPFGMSIGIISSRPSQTFFEVTDEFIVGDYRVCMLGNRDDDESLDDIISVSEELF